MINPTVVRHMLAHARTQDDIVMGLFPAALPRGDANVKGSDEKE
jgi:hypothetical protein